MKISKDTARSIVAEVSSAIGKNVNLMDETGCIIASTNKGRIGTYHSGAKKIIAERLDRLDVYTDATVIIGLNQQSLEIQGVAPV